MGSIKLLSNDFRNAEELRKNIAIKGGTTEAALKVFIKNNELKKIVNKAIVTAHKKAIKLGKK